MKREIAYCGLECTVCTAFIATERDDDQKRLEVAELWSTLYKADIKARDINCLGCKSEGGRLFKHCSVCEVRKCARQRGLENCAECDDYGCEILQEFFKMAPEAEYNLKQIRS